MNEIIRGMKKIIAISVAGAAALLVANWRKAQRESGGAEAWTPADEGIAMEPGIPLEESPPEPAWAEVSAKSSKTELYEAARELGIEGRSKMSKAELLAAIRGAR